MADEIKRNQNQSLQSEQKLTSVDLREVLLDPSATEFVRTHIVRQASQDLNAGKMRMKIGEPGAIGPKHVIEARLEDEGSIEILVDRFCDWLSTGRLTIETEQWFLARINTLHSSSRSSTASSSLSAEVIELDSENASLPTEKELKPRNEPAPSSSDLIEYTSTNLGGLEGLPDEGAGELMDDSKRALSLQEVFSSVRDARDVGPALRSTRKSLAVSQKAVAQAMGTTQSAISDMEKSGSNPTVETLFKYLQAVEAASAEPEVK